MGFIRKRLTSVRGNANAQWGPPLCVVAKPLASGAGAVSPVARPALGTQQTPVQGGLSFTSVLEAGLASKELGLRESQRPGLTRWLTLFAGRPAATQLAFLILRSLLCHSPPRAKL